MAAAHVVVPVLDGSLDPADVHHLQRVLRLRAGEAVTMTDGHGGWREGVFAGDRIEPTADAVRRPRPDPPVTIGFAPVKGDRPEWTVQKLTELGVDTIVVFHAARSVVRWDEPKLDKLRRVAKEALAQSRGCWLPAIAWCDGLPDGALAHFDGGPITDPSTPILVGPEGGWTDLELADRARVSLGPTVLRAETAALAAGVRLTALRNGS